MMVTYCLYTARPTERCWLISQLLIATAAGWLACYDTSLAEQIMFCKTKVSYCQVRIYRSDNVKSPRQIKMYTDQNLNKCISKILLFVNLLTKVHLFSASMFTM